MPDTAPGDRESVRPNEESLDTKIRDVLAVNARLLGDPRALGDSDDLYANGLSSHASVSVMLALEETFEIEFPDDLLRKSTFGSIASIREALVSLGC